ncbi:hypothetical protein ACFE04_022535 [Oxalis oulophora]
MSRKADNFPKREFPDPEGWSEEELDNLWMGVRRHGEWCWEVVLNSPFLCFLERRTSEDLQAKWATQRPIAFGKIDTNKYIAAYRDRETALKLPTILEILSQNKILEFQTFSSTSKVNQSEVCDNKHEESEVESKPTKPKSFD